MNESVLLLFAESVAAYGLVLGAHSLRSRFGLAHFYALLGGITAVMSWVTDAGVRVAVGGIIFPIGSAVLYTSLLLGVFVVYVFDGPKATRIAISAIVGVSIMVPIIAALLHFQMDVSLQAPPGYVPVPSFRINAASILTTLTDLLFLAIAWEFLGRHDRRVRLGIRAFLTLLGVMWLDVVLFQTGAFAGTPQYIGALQGTLISRFVVSTFAAPFLWAYLRWQSSVSEVEIERRPILAILQQLTETREELGRAQQEITRRKRAEEALISSEKRYRLLIENANEAIVVAQDGRMKLFNRKLSDITGFSESELSAMPLEHVLHPEDKKTVLNHYRRTIEGVPQQALLEFRILDKIGRERWLESNAVRIDWDGAPASLSFLTDVTQRKEVEATLREMATMDGLTNVYNRRHFMEVAEHEVDRAKRYGRPISLLMIDADRFKSINDTYGHEVGDLALRHLAGLARLHTRESDSLGRIGGEEFALLLPETTPCMAVTAAERLRRSVEQARVQMEKGSIQVTVSVGVAGSENGSLDLDELLFSADNALYRAKRQGRNRVATEEAHPRTR